MKVACEEHLFPWHVLKHTRRLDSIFAGTGGAPLGDHGFAGNAVGHEKVEETGAAATADHDSFKAPSLPCKESMTGAPI